MAVKVEISEENAVEGVDGMSLEFGQIGKIVGVFREGLLVLRTFDGLVLLSDPAHTWSVRVPRPRVRPIRNATVTLTFGTGG